MKGERLGAPGKRHSLHPHPAEPIPCWHPFLPYGLAKGWHALIQHYTAGGRVTIQTASLTSTVKDHALMSQSELHTSRSPVLNGSRQHKEGEGWQGALAVLCFEDQHKENIKSPIPEREVNNSSEG